MTKWYRLLDRTIPNRQRLKVERAKINGQTWYIGTIPPPAPPKKGRTAGLFKEGQGR